MHMPVMDGLEASAKILELNVGIPIVAMTANIMSNDLELYRKSGMCDYVGKPFTSQELWRCLMKYFTPVNRGTMDMLQVEKDADFQKALQVSFVKSNQHKIKEIKSALEEGDITLAHRLVHSLKSNAGQIGKTVLQKVAADIEYRLENGKDTVTKEQMKVLETELTTVLNTLSPLLDDPASENDEDLPPDLETEKALELIEKLEPMLKMGNPKCLELIDSLHLIPESEKLIQQIEDFDFEPAVVTLAELRSRLENNG